MTGILLYYHWHRGTWRLSETERLWATYTFAVLIVLLILWGGIVLTRYFFREQMIRRKMRWSAEKDPVWNYDEIIESAKDLYGRAQLLLNSSAPAFLSKLTPYARARMRLFRKRVKSASDIQFDSVYIVCFDDRRNNEEDSVAVYLKIRVRGIGTFEEIIVLHRYGNGWKITDYVKNPTMFMIAHARSIVEKS